MSDIIVTTPRGQMANAALEAADCIEQGGGEYFRRFAPSAAPDVHPGDRVYYVEDGYVRGFAIVDRAMPAADVQVCDTTGRPWPPGFYVFMNATSWRWIKPIPMRGFQNFRYASYCPWASKHVLDVGGWLDPRPEVGK